MSIEHKKEGVILGNDRQEYELRGRLPVEGKVERVDSSGHSGSMTVRGEEWNFVTQHGLKVEVGNTVRGEAPPASSEGKDSPGAEHRNKKHGGPKVIITSVKSR